MVVVATTRKGTLRMFIRVSHMRVREGSMETVLQMSQKLIPITKGMAGLHDYYTVKASETELLTIGVWESQAAEQAAAGQIHGELMTSFGPYLEGRPQNWGGDATSVAGK
jgi:quinol monooxygenase YgiN